MGKLDDLRTSYGSTIEIKDVDDEKAMKGLAEELQFFADAQVSPSYGELKFFVVNGNTIFVHGHPDCDDLVARLMQRMRVLSKKYNDIIGNE